MQVEVTSVTVSDRQAPSDTARYGTEMARWPVTLNDTRALPCSIATVLVASAMAAAGVLASA